MKNNIHVRPHIYDPHDIVSLDREHYIPYSYNNITIDNNIMGDPRQKIYIIKLQLLCIISLSHDAFGSIKGQSRYIYYRHQCQNQAKNSKYSRMFRFCAVNSRTGQVIYIIGGKISN